MYLSSPLHKVLNFFTYFREISLLKRLSHRHVIALIDVLFNEEKQKMYVVFEYCIGGLNDLLDHAPNNKFPIWQAHG